MVSIASERCRMSSLFFARNLDGLLASHYLNRKELVLSFLIAEAKEVVWYEFGLHRMEGIYKWCLAVLRLSLLWMGQYLIA